MKRLLTCLVITALMLSIMPTALAQSSLPPERLVSLTHNAPNTGKMLPETFSPYQDTYLLTVASWVSRITFTPVTSSPLAVVTVNGQTVASNQKSQIIQLTNDPQQVQIVVSAYDTNHTLTGQTVYTVYLQRRPSERRTRVSAGYITQIDINDDIATVHADLVTLNYQYKTNISSFVNDTVYIYKYKTAPNCLYYFGSNSNPTRALSAQDFVNHYLSFGSNLYYLVYIEDEIVAIFPYAAD